MEAIRERLRMEELGGERERPAREAAVNACQRYDLAPELRGEAIDAGHGFGGLDVRR